MQLFQYGSGFVWMNQGVGGMSQFFVKDRLIEDGITGMIMSKLVTDLVYTENLIAFRFVPKHI